MTNNNNQIEVSAVEAADKRSISFSFEGKGYKLPAYRDTAGDDAVIGVSIERTENYMNPAIQYIRVDHVIYGSGPGVYCGQLFEI